MAKNIDDHLERFHVELKKKADKSRFHENEHTGPLNKIFEEIPLDANEKRLAQHFTEHYEQFRGKHADIPELALHSLARFGKVFAGPKDTEHKKTMISLFNKLHESGKYGNILQKGEGNKFKFQGFNSTPSKTPVANASATNTSNSPLMDNGEDLDLEKDTKGNVQRPLTDVDRHTQLERYISPLVTNFLKDNKDKLGDYTITDELIETFRKKHFDDFKLLALGATYPDAIDYIKRKVKDNDYLKDLIQAKLDDLKPKVSSNE